MPAQAVGVSTLQVSMMLRQWEGLWRVLVMVLVVSVSGLVTSKNGGRNCDVVVVVALVVVVAALAVMTTASVRVVVVTAVGVAEVSVMLVTVLVVVAVVVAVVAVMTVLAVEGREVRGVESREIEGVEGRELSRRWGVWWRVEGRTVELWIKAWVAMSLELSDMCGLAQLVLEEYSAFL